MNTLFGNNVVNKHAENKESTNPNFQQSSSGEANYTNNNSSATQQTLFGDTPTSGLDPINLDNIPDFKSIEYKDGRIDGGDDDWVERKKCTMAEIEGQPIVIRSVHKRKSKLYEGSDYISINFVNADGEECFVNSSAKTIEKQLGEKNMQYPFRATIKACPKKDNPNMKYYKLT